MSGMFSPVVSFILSNTPAPEFNPDTVTPGPWGFFAIFFVAAVTLLLGMDLARRIRRTTYRAEMQDRLQAEVAGRDALAAQKKDTPEA
ncbi:hypothetical protein RCH12_001172 [Cryobacterium sp. MP_3.1]|nr:hypothetical protein [Cryobacterium sp. MP_3.1]